MGCHTRHDDCDSLLQQGQAGYPSRPYWGRHDDTERQPGRLPDGAPDSWFELIIDRGSGDQDLWDR